jgi:quinol monooxygenase YgiN
VAVIVVVQRRARTGQAEALIAAARRRWMGPSAWPQGRRHVRLFQSTQEPERILYVAEWDSAEAYLANRRKASTAGLDALCVAPAPPQFYTWRWHYQNLARTPAALSAITLRVPPDVLPETLQYVEEARSHVRDAAGLVLHTFCQDTADPGQPLVLHGWASAEAMAAHRQDTAPAMIAAHRARGVQVDLFVGQPRADEDQWAHLTPGQATGSPIP